MFFPHKFRIELSHSIVELSVDTEGCYFVCFGSDFGLLCVAFHIFSHSGNRSLLIVETVVGDAFQSFRQRLVATCIYYLIGIDHSPTWIFQMCIFSYALFAMLNLSNASTQLEGPASMGVKSKVQSLLQDGM